MCLPKGLIKSLKLLFRLHSRFFWKANANLSVFKLTSLSGKTLKKFLKKNTNENVKLVECIDFSNEQKKLPALDILIQWAKYEARPVPNKNESILNFKDLEYNTNKCLSCDEILITRKTKKGLNKVTNYRNSLNSLEFKDGLLTFVLKTGQDEHIPSLRADEFLKAVYGEKWLFDIKRVCFFDKDLKVL